MTVTSHLCAISQHIHRPYDCLLLHKHTKPSQSWDKLNISIKEVTALFRTITSHWRSKIHYLIHSLMPFTLLACDSNSPSASLWKLKIIPYCRSKTRLQVRAFWSMYFASVTSNLGLPVIVDDEMMQVQVQIYNGCEIFTLVQGCKAVSIARDGLVMRPYLLHISNSPSLSEIFFIL